MKNKLVFLILLVRVVVATAQTPLVDESLPQVKHTISGSLRDAATGESLIGATVYVPGLEKGTTTNTYGFYSLINAEDLKAVIEVLKYRYGQDISIFLWSKSFGGMVASAFMTKDNYQDLVKGWLFVDASHNYGLNDGLTYHITLRRPMRQSASSTNRLRRSNFPMRLLR